MEGRGQFRVGMEWDGGGKGEELGDQRGEGAYLWYIIEGVSQ